MCEEIYCVLQNALSFIIAFRNIQTLCATILAHWILVLSVWKKTRLKSLSEPQAVQNVTKLSEIMFGQQQRLCSETNFQIIGSFSYETFGSWKKLHQPNFALAKNLATVLFWAKLFHYCDSFYILLYHRNHSNEIFCLKTQKSNISGKL